MSVAALAAAPAAPHPEPQTAAAGVHSRGAGLTVRVPLRLVVGAQYPDAALSVYVKIAALALRPEGCTARVTTLATYLGMSKSAVERGLKTLRNPDPVDGLVEVPTVRRTLPGGRGQSAHRITRPLTERELWVRIPVRAAETLTPRLLRLYALLAYSTARRIPVTAAELGEMLRHHTGQRAGETLGERQVRRLVDELETTGWLTVHRREGERGRHAYEPHRHPLHAVPTPAEDAPADGEVLDGQEPEQLALFGPGAPVINDGSGPDLGDGSLASKEDHPTDRPDETKPVGVSRRRRGDRKWVARPVDNSVPDTFRPSESRAARGNRPASSPTSDRTTNSPGAYSGPELRWTPRIHTALAPVRHELDDVRRFVLRRIAREIAAQLDTGISPDRMAHRIHTRYTAQARTDIRDIGSWLLAVGIRHKGCGVPSCEDGRVWPTGEACEICAHQRQVQRATWRQARELEARLQQLRAERAAAAADEDQAQPEGRALPAKATYRQRDAVSDDQIRAVIAARGPEIALHVYGHYRVLPLLAAPQDPQTGGPHAQ
ncbi:hypothetical protein AB0K66_04565 [Streptomyces werraensis]|uniref:hypothetical protein n=1 Tax=Streptomyces werraensis TaxID=68284 RepID=UPI00342E3C1A